MSVRLVRAFGGVIVAGGLVSGTLFCGFEAAAQSTVSSLSDAQIESNVLRALATDPQLSTQDVQSSTVYGTVTLSGSVQTEAMRVSAENLAARAQGVQKVIDELTLSATPGAATAGAVQSGAQPFAGQTYAQPANAQPGQAQQQYPGQPIAEPGQAQQYPGQGQPYPSQPYPAQPNAQPGQAQPYSGQPNAQPYPGQPYTGQPNTQPGQTEQYPGRSNAQPGQAQPYPGQPYGQPYSGQPNAQPGQAQPYPGQPYGQPYSGQPNAQPGQAQPYPGQPYSGQPNAQPGQAQPYPGQPYSGQPAAQPGQAQPYTAELGAPAAGGVAAAQGGRQPMDSTGAPAATDSSYQGGQAAGIPVTITAGSLLRVRINRGLNSNHVRIGESFDGTVMTDVLGSSCWPYPCGGKGSDGTMKTDVDANNEVAIPRGATVSGVVVGAHKAGLFKGEGALSLQINNVTLGAHVYPITTTVWSHTGADKLPGTISSSVGLGAVGALMGGAFGGGAGAAIGAAAGAGTGLAASASVPRGALVIPPEAVLTFQISAPATVKTVSQEEMDRLASAAGPSPQPMRRGPPGYYGPYGPYGAY